MTRFKFAMDMIEGLAAALASKGETVGRISMMGGVNPDPGCIEIYAGGTYSTTTYPNLLAWFTTNAAAFPTLSAADIANGVLPDMKGYVPRTAGGTLAPAQGVKQDDATKVLAAGGGMSNSSIPTYTGDAPGRLSALENNVAYYGVQPLSDAGSAGYTSTVKKVTLDDAFDSRYGRAVETRVKNFGVRWQIRAAGALSDPGLVVISAIEARVTAIETAGVTNLTTAQTVAGAKTFSNLLTANAGIAFPAIQVPSSNANVLDDYEEGTWTPTIGINNSSTGITYFSTNTFGRYVKIGSLVWVLGNVQLTSKGNSVGDVAIGTLPFLAADTYNAPLSLDVSVGSSGLATQLSARFYPSPNHNLLQAMYANATGTGPAISSSMIGNGTVFRVFGCYRAEA